MTDARTQAIAQPNQLAKQQAIEYRRQLLRIVDQIERDYGLGKHAPVFEIDNTPGVNVKTTYLKGTDNPGYLVSEYSVVDTPPK